MAGGAGACRGDGDNMVVGRVTRRHRSCWPVKGAFAALLVVIGLFLASSSARADGADDLSDHERARKAMIAGEVAPLSEALIKAGKIYPGEVIEVELENEAKSGDKDKKEYGATVEGFIYELKVLTEEGNVLKIKMNAKTLEFLSVEGHDGKEHKE